MSFLFGKSQKEADKLEPNSLSWSLLKVPDKYLAPEQILLQNEYQNSAKNLVSQKQHAPPTDIEITSVLEIAALKSFLKLGRRTFAYQQLVDAIRKGEKEKVFEIVAHNSGLFEAIADDLGSSLAVGKSENFNSKREFYLEGICPFDLIPKIPEKQEESQRKRENETKYGYVEVSISEEELGGETDLQGEPATTDGNSDGKANDASNVSNYSDARSGSSTGESSTIDNSESQELEVPVELNGIQKATELSGEDSTTPTNSEQIMINFQKELEKLMAPVSTEKKKEVPIVRNKEDDKKAKIDKEQFDQKLRKLHQQDEKEYKELNEKARKEMEKQLKTFRAMLAKMEKDAREAEELEMEQAKERSDKEAAEFRKQMEEKMEKHRAAMEAMRKERERIEREAEEARRQQLADFQIRTEAFWRCVLQKLKWEEQEQQWADWIKTLKSSIVKVKVQFMNCEGSLRSYKESESSEMIQMDLSFLRQKTQSCHELLYDAFFHLKDLSEKIPDRLFLRILMRSLQQVADKILMVLMELDKGKINENTYEKLQGMFGTFDASEILATWKLREISKSARLEDYENIKDPMKYQPEGPKIQEVPEPSESEETRV